MTEIIYEADYPSGGERTGIMSIGGVARTLSATDYKQPPSIVLPVLTPEREEKRQNGRRFKDNNEDMFTLTAQDRHGVAIGINTMPDGTCRTLKNQYQKNSAINFSMEKGDRAATAVAVEIKEATKQGYAIAHEGDSINLSMPDSKTRRGRIGGGGGSNVGHKLQSGCDRDDSGDYP